ncbi:non-ribosomal peptide synthetase, partial [Microbulbifer taiwanensis]
RLWFIDNLQGGSPEYNMPMAFEVTGHLNLPMVRDVFNTIIDRHEILRTVYVTQEGETVQHIRNRLDVVFDVQVKDLSHLAGDVLDDQVKALVESDITTPFNLAEDLMLRVSYVKKTAGSGVIIFNMHHIASDGWSMNVLFKEFLSLYEAYSQGQMNPLPALTVQYADYAHWQHEHLEGDLLESQLCYWEKQLDDLPALHSLPLDYVRPKIKQHKGAIVTADLPATVARQLLDVAKAHELTPFMLLHGALSLLLSRHSNSTDIVIGTPVANRLQAELESLIGFFVNTLVLRADTKHDTLSDYFAHIRKVHLDAQSNQDVPFEQLVERLKVPRSTAHSPLFQIMLTTNTDYGSNSDLADPTFKLPDVNIQPYQSDLTQAKFDLTVNLGISEKGVSLRWNYDVSLFSEQHITQLNDHLCRLLEGLGQSRTQSSQQLRDLPMLSADEIQYLVHDLNDTAMDYPRDKCIHELFEQQAQSNPDNIAIIFADNSLTYKQLNEKANQLAHYLKEHYDIVPDTLVGLCVERSLEMVIGILGILKAGGAYVPLDPSYPPDRLSYMLEDAELGVVLSLGHMKSVLAEFNGHVLELD